MKVELNRKEVEALIKVYVRDRIAQRFAIHNDYEIVVKLSKDSATAEIISTEKE